MIVLTKAILLPHQYSNGIKSFLHMALKDITSVEKCVYTTTTNRVGFNVINIILGETPLNGNNKEINCILLCCKQ